MDHSRGVSKAFIPYARLISAMIVQQNCLPPESLWVSKPQEEFNIASMKKNWEIDVNLAGNKYVVTDRLGHKYEFLNPDAQQGDEEMYDEEDETEPDGPRGPQQRYMRRHREINANVAGFVKQRQGPTFKNYNRGQQACYDNISACIGEGREYNRRRENWEGTHGTYSREQWAAQAAYRERMEKFMEEQQLHQALQQSHMERLIQLQEEDMAHRRAWEEREEKA
ncbi:hypothetical protein HanPSC8_Chr08g0327601 [Helianthus annuus]|nr:hypothetical protein HanPSC8_Chr08g0327601 [Helianthus annuus]